jgi:putative tryptophan/tyrosine transport system substrate-binding protein
MRRRKFLGLIGGATVAWPLAARGQQSAMPVVGFLNGASPPAYARMLSAFLNGLRETGYVESQNVKIEYRWAQGELDRLPGFAAELVHREVAVIAATGTPAALAAKTATATIPIVFETGSDPVQLGLVASLNRPGGNVTGVAQLAVEVVPKRLQLLNEVVPAAKIVALLVDPTDPAVSEKTIQGAHTAARSLGLELHVLNVSTENEIDAAFAKMAQLQVRGVMVSGGQFFNSRSKQIAAMARQHTTPTIFPYRDLAAAGGLMSYGTSITDAYRLAGTYTGRILQGEKPADLPVQQATKIELIINLETAKALGITVPLSLLGRADEVIE